MPFNPNTATHPITRTLVTNQQYDLQDIDHDAIIDQINTNMQAINQNAADITAADADIQKNTADIQKNTADIQKNTADIQKNTADIQKNTADISAIANIIYPVGSIYMSVNNTSPATLFGGTWEQIKDMFLLPAGDTYAAGSTGGSAKHTPTGTVEGHTLTADEIPAHAHGANSYYSGYTVAGSTTDTENYATAVIAKGITDPKFISTAPNGIEMKMSQTGGGQSHSHDFTGTEQDTMPPYIAVYCWKRTA